MVSLQNNMQMHDELAALFHRNLSFNPQPQPQPQLQQPPPQPILQEEPRPEPAQSQPIIYSISQHYTHSAHVAKPYQASDLSQEAPQRPSSEPPQNENAHTENLLRHHGVDPANLTLAQVQLFRFAHPSQQRRLLELWSIYPPSKDGEIQNLAWNGTTMEQEEQLARIRCERANRNTVMSLDGTPVQTGDGKWIQDCDADVEPYMASGYEELMRREYEQQAQQQQEQQQQQQLQQLQLQQQQQQQQQPRDYIPATDPVYMGPDCVRQQQQMEMATQYGAFQQFRGGEADAMDVM